MLDSFQIAAALVTRGFDPITQTTRTKAHGYQHPQMLYPVYVKIRGPKGDLRAAVESPLVIHRADAARIEAASRLPDGVALDVAPYHSAGLLAYREREMGTPSGRALAVSDGVSLNRLLDILLDDGANESPRTMLSDAAPTEELAFPDSWQSRAAATAVDTDSQSESIGATTRVALINARIGQGNYRRSMMTIWGGRCALTGCAVPEVLVASHALPWAHASNEARLDPYNRLLLIATLDRLFDQGANRLR